MNAVPNPVSSPLALINAHVSLSTGQLSTWLFLIVAFVWAIYTLVLIYHWIRYSHAAAIAVPAIGIHLAVSIVLILYAASGLV